MVFKFSASKNAFTGKIDPPSTFTPEPVQKFVPVDPLELCHRCWPDVTFYNHQRDIIYSVVNNDETVVPAGNKLGKDFVSAFIALYFFISRTPVRVLTTSVDGTQLEGVLWGEIRRFIQTSKFKLPIIDNHLHLKQIVNGRIDGISYMIGRVAAKGEGMLGHHVTGAGVVWDGVPRSLFIADEASGVDDASYNAADTWAERKLIIGNPFPCNNFFFRAVKGDRENGIPGGDLPKPNKPGVFDRRVIRIKGEDSPNVRLGLIQASKGKTPTNEVLVPGVLSYEDYLKRRRLWDKIKQCVSLDADFYEGAEVLLYPPEWLNLAERRATELESARRIPKTMGVDPAEGGDSSVWSIVDDYGLMEQISQKTPDTSSITSTTIALLKQYGIPPEACWFDRGGGGKQHADRLRTQGYNVNTVSFGESVLGEKKRGLKTIDTANKESEERYAYKNRRAQMYGFLRLRLDPTHEKGFGIPKRFGELRRQLSPIPLWYDSEGRLELPPKNKRPGDKSGKITLFELLGRSPDEADSLVLAVYGLDKKSRRKSVGVAF